MSWWIWIAIALGYWIAGMVALYCAMQFLGRSTDERTAVVGGALLVPVWLPLGLVITIGALITSAYYRSTRSPKEMRLRYWQYRIKKGTL